MDRRVIRCDNRTFYAIPLDDSYWRLRMSDDDADGATTLKMSE